MRSGGPTAEEGVLNLQRQPAAAAAAAVAGGEPGSAVEIQRWANQDNERGDTEGHHGQRQWRTREGHQKHQGKGHTQREKGARRDHKS